MKRWRVLCTLTDGVQFGRVYLDEENAALATEAAREQAVLQLQADRDAATMQRERDAWRAQRAELAKARVA